jgi:hypothetical protein
MERGSSPEAAAGSGSDGLSCKRGSRNKHAETAVEGSRAHSGAHSQSDVQQFEQLLGGLNEKPDLVALGSIMRKSTKQMKSLFSEHKRATGEPQNLSYVRACALIVLMQALIYAVCTVWWISHAIISLQQMVFQACLIKRLNSTSSYHLSS